MKRSWPAARLVAALLPVAGCSGSSQHASGAQLWATHDGGSTWHRVAF